jgi:hypothetical protein
MAWASPWDLCTWLKRTSQRAVWFVQSRPPNCGPTTINLSSGMIACVILPSRHSEAGFSPPPRSRCRASRAAFARLLAAPGYTCEVRRLLGCALNTMRSNGLRAPSPLPESLKPPFVHGERTESTFFNFTKGEQTDKATRALHRMALSETVP